MSTVSLVSCVAELLACYQVLPTLSLSHMTVNGFSTLFPLDRTYQYCRAYCGCDGSARCLPDGGTTGGWLERHALVECNPALYIMPTAQIFAMMALSSLSDEVC